MTTEQPHVVIVGAYGSAGVAAAEELVDEDVTLTLIDDGEPGGGLCILRGCMPSKEVLSAGAHRYQARHDDRLTGAVPDVDLDAVVDTKDDHVLGFAEHRRAAVHDMAEREHVTFHHDTARFVDDRTLVVDGERIEADYVVLGTGSALNVPDLPGIADTDWMGSRDVLDATEFPDSGVVMGFGYVGVELVPYLSEAADMDLTVIEHDDRPLDSFHPVFGEEILAQYREEFDVDIRTEVREEAVEETDDGGVRVRLDDGTTAAGEQLFLFTGRTPSYPAGIEETRLTPDPEWVDPATMQARDDDHVFVVGDAMGERMLLHNAKEEGYAAGRNALAVERGGDLETYDPFSHQVMFSGLGVFPFASLGLTAEAARAAGHDVVTSQRDASSDGVFKTKDAARGAARLVVDADDGTVLGYHGLHYHADVMAKTMQVVLAAGMDVREIPDRAYHPTTPEVLDGLFGDAAAEL
ncbi:MULTISPECIES: FAD-dependent oxidoreductase [Halobacterium]|uniref:FAD-dependent oxidoreductase n=1 Tax=Halobacterium TaxID=2239 RepID=UPI001964C5AE|nr:MULTISPECIES: NAD(P)/FAD-dependent oxidoreductase [Halobacterium]MCF2166080.1 NAD(P)/FAD-dependent oxidoreductase [Halobacterium salinarum]MCF2166826.1 NAD(P)/FAD-dependent oxidoreductase [Halobacterium salinarum]MDL0129102.1 NAD(P)/FAD-dependent oxidoreductase [Halobacterium salinarum]QRY22834.1 NAD(P)/FAD-dependent oxidoreductase [Halobacterium sp. GSL-19]WJK64137.1 NAD(P)/FAD-dependent oxidoreductase [Halobacterium salinarum]